ncbi:MAG: 3',5'-cyclic-AMP phosphodiesterase [Succinivibrio sp.]|nr:3',5'-cyclic-AMP phosphodiesterase [Succinivibrio sp.]
MSDIFTLTPKAADESVRILQLTDTHLFAQGDRTLLGVNTKDSFSAVLDALEAKSEEFDFVLVTGDISQDYSPESYQLFAALIARLKQQVFFLPGNHDDGPLMYRMFGNLNVHTEKSIVCGHWQLVCLNSEVYGVPHGWLQREELNYLRKMAKTNRQLHTVACLHHLPRMVGCAWLDTQTLHNQNEFYEAVRDLDNLRLVLSGHVHQEVDEMHEQVRYLASPSTSIQFAPHSLDFALDYKAPGWRTLTLHPDGQVETEVHRLQTESFRPNFDSRGY